MTGPARLPLTIITPVYNCERYIEETIRSIVAEMRDGDQYVIVDDGSTDHTPVILERFAAEPGLTIITQTNGGEVAAVNTGVSAATNMIVGIVNADDPILPGLLDEVSTAFANDLALDAVYPDWRKIDSKGATIADVKTYEYDYAVLLAQHMCIPGPGAFFRTAALRSEPVRARGAEDVSDYDFWLRFGLHGAKIRRLPKTLATWRLHVGGTTIRAQGRKLAEAKIRIIKRLFERPDVPAGIRALESQAVSAAYYHAALVGLRSSSVPALRFAVQSVRIAPRWPADVLPHQRRSWRHLSYAALQPVSGVLHGLISPLLPLRFSRQAVLHQTFGTDAAPQR